MKNIMLLLMVAVMLVVANGCGCCGGLCGGQPHTVGYPAAPQCAPACDSCSAAPITYGAPATTFGSPYGP